MSASKSVDDTWMSCKRVRNGKRLPAALALLGLTVLLPMLLGLPAACAPGSAGLLRPNGVAVAADGSVYVMDRGHYRIVHLDADGRWLGAMGHFGTGREDIYSGWDAALDAGGNVYVCNLVRDDEGYVVHDGIKVFAADGRLLREVGAEGYDDQSGGQRPYGLDLDDQGRVYAADFGANTLRVFDSQGNLLGTFFGQTGSADGAFIGLHDVAVDDRRGLIYLSDNTNARIQQYSLTVSETGTLSLTHRLTFGSYGRGTGQFAYPQHLAVDDASGRLYVGDVANHRIQVFDSEGQHLAELRPPGVVDWQVMGLAVGADGAIYAADAFNNAVWVFEADGRLRVHMEGQR